MCYLGLIEELSTLKTLIILILSYVFKLNDKHILSFINILKMNLKI